MKTVGGEALSHTIYYTIISKFQKICQKFKNSLIVKKSTSQLSDIIVNACMQFENFPIKSVGEEAFYSFYIIHNYFKISKIRQKFKNSLILKNAQPMWVMLYLMPVCNMKTIRLKL